MPQRKPALIFQGANHQPIRTVGWFGHIRKIFFLRIYTQISVFEKSNSFVCDESIQKLKLWCSSEDLSRQDSI